MDIFQQMEHRDAAEVLPATLPDAIDYQSHREFVKQTLRNEVNLRARGTEVVDASQEKPDWPSVQYREQMNRDGSPSQEVATGYIWTPGTELAANSPTPVQQRRSTGQSNIRQERKAS
jgi:hypothetical protein